MGKTIKEKLAEKIDVSITGYISSAAAALTAAALAALIVLSAAWEGELPVWAAFAGFLLMLINFSAIRLSRWGQDQTGRRLKWNKRAVWMNRLMIIILAAVYVFGVVLMIM